MSNKLERISMMVFGILFILFCAEAQADVTYSYSGNPYTNVSGSYTTSMRVTGHFTIAAPLSPNLPMTDIRPSVLGYSFFDGVQTLTDSNSKIIVLALSTDASGQIQEWRVTIWEIPITGVFGGVVRGIDAIFTGGFVDDKGFTDGSCISVNGGLCDSVNINVGNFGFMSSANPDDAGSWNSSVISQEKMSVPTINEWGMIIFMVLACIGSIYYVRRKRIDG